MENRGFGGDYRRLQSEYLSWVTREVQRLNRTPVVWQEAWQNGDFSPEDVIVHVWLGDAMDLINKVGASWSVSEHSSQTGPRK